MYVTSCAHGFILHITTFELGIIKIHTLMVKILRSLKLIRDKRESIYLLLGS